MSTTAASKYTEYFSERKRQKVTYFHNKYPTNNYFLQYFQVSTLNMPFIFSERKLRTIFSQPISNEQLLSQQMSNEQIVCQN